MLYTLLTTHRHMETPTKTTKNIIHMCKVSDWIFSLVGETWAHIQLKPRVWNCPSFKNPTKLVKCTTNKITIDIQSGSSAVQSHVTTKPQNGLWEKWDIRSAIEEIAALYLKSSLSKLNTPMAAGNTSLNPHTTHVCLWLYRHNTRVVWPRHLLLRVLA